ncbi:hypothetical protein [Sphingobium sp. WCS2017Hpa-17]|uniref:hypothetical protein n=1 Tax=Sphingobium sp. WCS2017Hpa-17 TaxID=3073638 RepID=UPI00288B7408|nr:hypothetical protein [Sphingobium sp. WCS2017Hpa-17]
MATLQEFRKRSARRIILGEIPEDLEMIESDWLLRLIRQYVPKQRDGIERHRERGRRQAFQYPAMFHVPGAPRTTRPVSANGHVTFHFAKNCVVGREAGAFDHYSARKAAIAAMTGQEIDSGEGQSATLEMQELEDHAARLDHYAQGHGGDPGHAPEGFTNLSQDEEVRKVQWRAIEAHERGTRANPDGKGPGITLFYDRAPSLFDAAATDPACPDGLRRVIAREQKRAAKGKPFSASRAARGSRWTDESAFATYGWLKTHTLWPYEGDGSAPVAKVSEGRAVQTHLAGEGEYHRDMDAAARARVRMGLVAFVQDQANEPVQRGDGSFIPMTIFDHRPDGLNDARNLHYHFLMGTRRAKVGTDGALIFDDRKVDAITRQDWLDRMRGEIARLTNVELASIGASERFHPGTLVEMGAAQVDADIAPMQKLHGRRTVLERAGFSTDLGLGNDLEGWRRRFAAADRVHASTVAGIERDFSGEVRKAARAQALEAAHLRHEAAHIAILVEIARSRADQTAHYAPHYAEAAKSTEAAKGWEARGVEAKAWLARLDIELAPERAGLAERFTRAEQIEAALKAPHVEPTIAVSATELRAPRARSIETQSAPNLADLHRAVDLIAKAPLYISQRANGALFIAGKDDPEGLVYGHDLSPVQKRLGALRAVQARELAPVQAYARKHGMRALYDRQSPQSSAWLQDAITRWRDTPVMHRWATGQGMRVAPVPVMPRVPAAMLRRGAIRFLDDMPSLADLPALDAIPSMADMRSLDEMPTAQDRTRRDEPGADSLAAKRDAGRPNLTPVDDPDFALPPLTLAECFERPMNDMPTANQLSTLFLAMERIPLRLVDYHGRLRIDRRDDPDGLINDKVIAQHGIQQRLRHVQRQRDVGIAAPPVAPAVVAAWHASGVDAFAADVTAFDHIFVEPHGSHAPSAGSPLHAALGGNAHWLGRDDVKARLAACYHYQRMVRQDILFDLVRDADPDPGRKRGRPASTPQERMRHAEDPVLARERAWLVDGAVRHERRAIGNRLFAATMAAISAGESPETLCILADAARAQPNYRDIAGALPDIARKIHAVSSAPARGIYFERPCRRQGRDRDPGRTLR